MNMNAKKIAQIDQYTEDGTKFVSVYVLGGKVNVAHTLLDKVMAAEIEDDALDVPGMLATLNLQIKGPVLCETSPMTKEGPWPFKIFHIVKPDGTRFVTDLNLIDDEVAV